MRNLIRPLLFVVALFISQAVAAQNPQWHWLQEVKGTEMISGSGIVVDASGNTLVAGTFNGTAVLGGVSLESRGDSDIFLAKYNENGEAIWVKQAGGGNGDLSWALTVDGSNNMLVAMLLGEGSVVGDSTLSAGGTYVAKYDENGNMLWVTQAGSFNPRDIAGDMSGNISLTGHFVDEISIGDTTLTSFGSLDILVARFDKDGNFLWAAQAGGTGLEIGASVAVDEMGASYVTGWFSEISSFNDTTLTSMGFGDTFIAKYDHLGNLLWVLQQGGSSGDSGVAIALDADGNILVFGEFWEEATYGGETLTSLGQFDLFLAKYDAAGKPLWVRQAGGPEGDHAHDLAIDAAGNCLIIGAFRGDVTFDTVMLSETGGGGDADIFTAKYGADGEFFWVEQSGGILEDFPSAIAAHSTGDAVLLGNYGGSAQFGGETLTSDGERDVVIARLGDMTTDVDPASSQPSAFQLHQNYPNPFNPQTRINYDLSENAHVKISIYNTAGQFIDVIVDERQSAGTHSVVWDASGFSAGVYFIKMVAGSGKVKTQKALLLK